MINVKHKSVPTMPQHIRAFCDGEFYRYLMNKAFAEEARKDIATLMEEGGDKGFDKPIVQGGEFKPEQQRILERIEAIYSGRDAVIAEKCCQRVEDVIRMLNEQERAIMEQFYWRRIPPDITENETGIGRKTQQRMRRKMTYLLATRWGMA